MVYDLVYELLMHVRCIYIPWKYDEMCLLPLYSTILLHDIIINLHYTPQ